MKYNGTILITGGTAGIGYECALDLARSHPKLLILIASRSNPEAAKDINSALGQSNVQHLTLDLASQSKIRDFVEDYEKQSFPPLQALVLNAGLQIFVGLTETVDGLETTFAVNHVGHVLLFQLLRQFLTKKARIVITASGVHDPAKKTGVRPPEFTTPEMAAHPSKEKLDQTGNFNGGQGRYSLSKLCNVLWMYALHDHIKQSSNSWTVTAMDPGLVPGTSLLRDAPFFIRLLAVHVMPHLVPLLRLALMTNVHRPSESGSALARLAVGTDVQGVSGVYYEGRTPIDSSKDSMVRDWQEALWTWTNKQIAKNDQELKSFNFADNCSLVS